MSGGRSWPTSGNAFRGDGPSKGPPSSNDVKEAFTQPLLTNAKCDEVAQQHSTFSTYENHACSKLASGLSSYCPWGHRLRNSLTDAGTRQLILRALREGALDHFQIAADIGAAPFLVRAELKRLRREQLVSEHLVRTTVAWHLTEKGVELAAGADHHESDE
jgi:DNA-binding HxlR family transcriptional regulator